MQADHPSTFSTRLNVQYQGDDLSFAAIPQVQNGLLTKISNQRSGTLKKLPGSSTATLSVLAMGAS